MSAALMSSLGVIGPFFAARIAIARCWASVRFSRSSDRRELNEALPFCARGSRAGAISSFDETVGF
jgi:hypothetical protein